MALHHELPIYKVAYDLYLLAVKLVSNLPRNFKRHLGDQVLGGSTLIMVLVFRANVSRNKVEHIDKLLEELEVVQLVLRVLKEMRLISLAQHAQAIAFTTSIGKQAGGWKKASASPAPGSPR